jgi:hypothetical protein
MLVSEGLLEISLGRLGLLELPREFLELGARFLTLDSMMEPLGVSSTMMFKGSGFSMVLDFGIFRPGFWDLICRDLYRLPTFFALYIGLAVWDWSAHFVRVHFAHVNLTGRIGVGAFIDLNLLALATPENIFGVRTPLANILESFRRSLIVKMTRRGLIVLKFDFAFVLGILKILSFTERGLFAQICQLVKFQ